MDGLSLAASIIAVIQLTDTVLRSCFKYANEVRDAKKCVKDLATEIKSLQKVLQQLNTQLRAPGGEKLHASQELQNDLKRCSAELELLGGKLLIPQKRWYTSTRLKWPFKKQEIEDAIKNLGRCKQSASLALQVDHTGILLDVDRNMNIVKRQAELINLPTAPGAAFDSYSNRHNEDCLPDTRTELRRQVTEWVDDPDGRCIFWLNGMAGTGKSTISRTLARHFKDKGQLGANFFFKRGEGTRGGASMLFTTITQQLVQHLPELTSSVRKALDNDPTISNSDLREQFHQLIMKPLCDLAITKPETERLILVIDALDECAPDLDIRVILELLCLVEDIKTIKVRIFITSRPDVPILRGFQLTGADAHRHLVLHNISDDIVRHDISVFLKHKLDMIKRETALSPDWPGDDNFKALLEMVVPLFICAATVCRSIADPRYSPEKRLKYVLGYQMSSQVSKLDATYRPVLDQLIVDLDSQEKAMIIQEFQDIVGSIATLYDPLSVLSLETILDIPKVDIEYRINTLHSVISVPTTEVEPVRFLHLSFREFLVDQQKKLDNYPFWVDEVKMHRNLAGACLNIMSGPRGLKKNMCNIQSSGIPLYDIYSRDVNDGLPAELEYACQYWVHHVKESRQQICDNDKIHTFLQRCFLYWFEALSLLDGSYSIINHLTTLQSSVSAKGSTEIRKFLYDAKWFSTKSQTMVRVSPLQIYSSALIFAPGNSTVRQLFKNQIPGWVLKLPEVEPYWGAKLQTLTSFGSTLLSPDGQLVASVFRDGNIIVYNIETGELSILKSAQSYIIRFCRNSLWILSGDERGNIQIWDTVTGCLRQTLNHPVPPSQTIGSIEVSPDNNILVSACSDGSIRFWNLKTGTMKRELKANSVNYMSFSADGRWFLSASCDGLLQVWDSATGERLWKRKARLYGLEFVKADILPLDGKKIVTYSGSIDFKGQVHVWDWGTDQLQHTLDDHRVNETPFSPDGRLIVHSDFRNGEPDELKLWDLATGDMQLLLENHSISQANFTADGKLALLIDIFEKMKLYDLVSGELKQTWESDNRGILHWATFTPDGKKVVSAGKNVIEVWDPCYDGENQVLQESTSPVAMFKILPGGRTVYSIRENGEIASWDTETGELRTTLLSSKEAKEFIGTPYGQPSIKAMLSPDSTLLWLNINGVFLIWNLVTATLIMHREKKEFDDDDFDTRYPMDVLAFSRDNSLFASSYHGKKLMLWNPITGEEEKSLKASDDDHGSFYWLSAAFSPTGQYLASGCNDGTIKIWDVIAGDLHRIIEGHSFTNIYLSPDRHSMFTLGSDTKWWNLSGGKWDNTIIRSSRFSMGEPAAISPNGQLWARCRYKDRTLGVYDSITGKMKRSWTAHSKDFYYMSFSPDSRFIMTCASREAANLGLNVRVWDPATGILQPILEGRGNIVAFSPDGKQMASSTYDDQIELWDLYTGKLIQTLEGQNHTIYDILEFSPNSDMMISGSHSYNIKLWQLSSTNRCLFTWQVNNKTSILRAIFSPDSLKIALKYSNSTIEVWDLTKITMQKIIFGATFAFSSNSQLLILIDTSGKFEIWDLVSEKSVKTWNGPSFPKSMEISPDGNLLASMYDDGRIILWNTITGDLQQTFEFNNIVSMGFSTDGIWLVGSSKEGVGAWNIETGDLGSELEGYQFTKIGFVSTDGKVIVTGQEGQSIELWDPITGHMQQILNHCPAQSVSCSQDGRIGIAIYNDLDTTSPIRSDIKVWESATGEFKRMLRGHKLVEERCIPKHLPRWRGYKSPISDSNFSPDGKVITFGVHDGLVKLWDPNSGDLKLLVDDKLVTAVAFSTDGQLVASGAEDGLVKVWNFGIKSRQPQITMDIGAKVFSLAFSPNNQQLAGSSPFGVILWCLATGEKLQEWDADQTRVTHVKFSSDGKLLVFGKILWLWDPDTGDTQLIFDGHSGQVDVVCYSYDGERIASYSSKDGTIKIWEASTGDLTLTMEVLTDDQIEEMRFSQDNSYLLTNQGSFRIPSSNSKAFFLQQKSSRGMHIGLDSTVKGAEDIINLPNEYRDTAVAQDGIVALSSKGKISFLHLKESI